MKKSILIYDDDLEILFVTKIILDKQDYSVKTKVTCDNIIKDLESEKPDLVLMDLWIPEMGGESAIHLMKNEEKTKDIPVLLFSAHDDIEAIHKRSGADGYLKKPFGIDELLDAVKNNLEEAG